MTRPGTSARGPGSAAAGAPERDSSSTVDCPGTLGGPARPGHDGNRLVTGVLGALDGHGDYHCLFVHQVPHAKLDELVEWAAINSVEYEDGEMDGETLELRRRVTLKLGLADVYLYADPREGSDTKDSE